MTYNLILLRHGESEWNQQNLFTGWVDVTLTDKGRAEGARAGELLREKELIRDVVYTSRLKRAILTANIALEAAALSWLDVHRTGRVNDAHDGGLQWKYKKESREEFGEEQLMIWRRRFDTPPPALADRSQLSQAAEARYANPGDSLPRTECLADVIDRLLPYWYDV